MRILRTVGRFLIDWRNGATLCASALIVMLAFTVVDGAQSRSDAFHAQKAQAEQALSAQRAASARITELRGQVGDLQSTSEGRGAQIAELVAELRALETQVRQMGGRPVVVVTTTTAAAKRETTTSTATTPKPADPEPAPTTTTTRPPAATTTTTSPPRGPRCVALNLPPGCS